MGLVMCYEQEQGIAAVCGPNMGYEHGRESGQGPLSVLLN